MAASGLIRNGGLASMAGGVLWIVALGGAQLRPTQLVVLVGLASLCLALGLLALRQRHVTRAGPLSSAGFALALLGAVALAYGSVGRLDFGGAVGGIGYGPFLFAGLAFGALLLGLGTGMIAVSAILADVLPRLSPIPLLLGALGIGVAGALGLATQLRDGPTHDVFPMGALPLQALWAVFGLAWLWLGFLLYTEQTHPGWATNNASRQGVELAADHGPTTAGDHAGFGR